MLRVGREPEGREYEANPPGTDGTKREQGREGHAKNICTREGLRRRVRVATTCSLGRALVATTCSCVGRKSSEAETGSASSNGPELQRQRK